MPIFKFWRRKLLLLSLGFNLISWSPMTSQAAVLTAAPAGATDSLSTAHQSVTGENTSSATAPATASATVAKPASAATTADSATVNANTTSLTGTTDELAPNDSTASSPPTSTPVPAAPAGSTPTLPTPNANLTAPAPAAAQKDPAVQPSAPTVAQSAATTTSGQVESVSTDSQQRDFEPAAPTSRDGVQAVDRPGLVLGIPLVSGFTSQPPAEQYVAEGEPVTLDAKFVEAELNWSGNAQVYVTKWSWQTDHWQQQVDPTAYAASSSANNRFAVAIKYGPQQREELPEGIYYFQLHFISGNLVRDTHYSRLAKVVVEGDDTAATALAVTTATKVIFPSVTYGATAEVQPSHSTSVVAWSGEQLTLDRQFGRSVNYQVKTAALQNWVNKDVDQPGLPLTLQAKANRLAGKTSVIAGGLAAIERPLDRARDQGIRWPVAGLTALKQTLLADPALTLTQVKYKWTYFQKNKRGRYQEADFPKTITSASGTTTDLSELNQQRCFQIAGTDPFINTLRQATMNQAPIYAKLTLNLALKNGAVTKNVTLNTNQAELRVTAPVGQLYLGAVPHFTFASVAARQIYQGNSSAQDQIVSQTDANNLLSIIDTRPNQQDWSLQVTLTAPQDQTGQALTGASLVLKSFALDDGELTLAANQAPVLVTSSADWQSGTFPLQADLKLAANPQAKLTAQTKFQATLHWNLTTTAPTVPALR